MDATPRHILLTGATGLLGSYLLPRLLAAGYRVRALYREEGTPQPDDRTAAGVEWVVGNLLEPASLEAALSDIDTIVHAAALVSYRKADREQLFRVNEIGTANLVNTALHSGVPRLIHIGSVATLDRNNGAPASEEQYWPQTPPLTAYGQSKFQAQREVWRGQAEGLSVATVFSAILVGDNPPNATLERLRHFSSRYPSFYPIGGNGFVAAADVATAIVRLLDRNQNGDRYLLSAANWSYRELFTAFAAAAHRPPPTRPISPRTLRWLGRLERWRGGSYADVLSPEAIRMASTTFSYDATKATRELDLTYTDVRTLLTS